MRDTRRRRHARSMRPETRFIPTRAGRLAAELRGDGPPLLLLHAGGHDRHDFDAVVPALATRFRTVALDLPGHGESEPFDPPHAAGAGAICDAVEDAVAAL